jgi:hypothetical protein
MQFPIAICGCRPLTAGPMSEVHIADLLALDTETLKGRLSELRRYL